MRCVILLAALMCLGCGEDKPKRGKRIAKAENMAPSAETAKAAQAPSSAKSSRCGNGQCDDDENEKSCARDCPKQSRILAMAAKADRNDIIVAAYEDQKQHLVVKNGKNYHRLGTLSFDDIGCYQDASGDLCVVRDGSRCGILHRRTGKLLESVTHACGEEGSVQMCGPLGQCHLFDDRTKYELVDGTFRKSTVPAPVAQPVNSNRQRAVSRPGALRNARPKKAIHKAAPKIEIMDPGAIRSHGR